MDLPTSRQQWISAAGSAEEVSHGSTHQGDHETQHFQGVRARSHPGSTVLMRIHVLNMKRTTRKTKVKEDCGLWSCHSKHAPILIARPEKACPSRCRLWRGSKKPAHGPRMALHGSQTADVFTPSAGSSAPQRLITDSVGELSPGASTTVNFRQCLAVLARDLSSLPNNQCGLVNRTSLPSRKKTRGFIEHGHADPQHSCLLPSISSESRKSSPKTVREIDVL